MIKEIPPQINTYLQKRVEQKWLNWKVENKYKTVIVIPVINESENIPNLIQSISQNDKDALQSSLLLFVVNNSADSSNEIISDNTKTISMLSELIQKENGINIDFVDTSSEGNELPMKDAGVGLARKIGMDQALLYFDYSVKGNSIVCLDADCEVGINYLTEIQKCFKSNYEAAVIKYEHKLENEAIINYEIFLRYYVLGLKFASSPYAYHSIGSCIVVSPLIYAKLGGMNKRKAGEDFYFLEKAAKISEVKAINSTTVYPSARKSWRVPFGTGQRISRFFEKTHDEYTLYHPESFIILKDFLSAYFNNKNESPENILTEAKSISDSLHQFLIENNFIKNLNRIYQNTKSDTQLYHQKITWFDAFRTLKLIHYLRDNGYPEQSMFTVLNEILDLMNIGNFERYTSTLLPPIEKQVEYLKLLRKLT